MGTSQSFNLKSTPNWSKAKRGMSSLVNGEPSSRKLDTLMSAFASALNEGNNGEQNNGGHHGHSSNRVFGKAGGSSSQKFLSFIGDVRQGGLADALHLEQEEFQNKTPQEIISGIYQAVSGGDNANFDDDAAKAALNELLSDIFKGCDDTRSIEEIFQDANQDTISYWIMRFYALYIAEFLGEVFQKQIYDHCDDPEDVQSQIVDLLFQKIEDRYGNDIRRLNLLSEEGKAFVGELSDLIISIWN